VAAQLTDVLVSERLGIKGTLTVAEIVALAGGGGGSLNVTTAPLYEYRDLWAEEAAALATGSSAEWSYGNGATGFMGVVFGTGWEVIEMTFHADTFGAGSFVNIDLMSYVTASNAAANTIASMSLTSETDGGGGANNAWKVQAITPTAVPTGPVGFITRSSGGGISDARVGARFRRQIGNYVTDVAFV